MAISYAYAVGSVRAHETTLLTRQDLEQLLTVKSSEQLTAVLRDKGYGNPTDSGDMDSLLRQETAKLWAYLQSITPDFSLFDAFLYRNDIHNMKAVLKGILGGRPFDSLLLTPCTIETSLLKTAVEEHKLSLLPLWMSGAAEQAYEVVAHTHDAQLGDAILDAAAMSAMLTAAQNTKVPLMDSLFRTFLFYANVKIALRAARTKKDGAYLRCALCPMEEITLGEWQHAVQMGETALVPYLEKQTIYACHAAIEQYKLSPSAFEKWVDDHLMQEARQGKTVILGAEALIGYLMAKEMEIKDIHMLASGIRTGQSEETMRERWRLLYA